MKQFWAFICLRLRWKKFTLNINSNKESMTKDNNKNDFIGNIWTVFRLRGKVNILLSIFYPKPQHHFLIFGNGSNAHLRRSPKKQNKSINETSRWIRKGTLLCMRSTLLHRTYTSESEPRPTCRAENFISTNATLRDQSELFSRKRVFNGSVALSLFTPYLEPTYGWL